MNLKAITTEALVAELEARGAEYVVLGKVGRSRSVTFMGREPYARRLHKREVTRGSVLILPEAT